MRYDFDINDLPPKVEAMYDAVAVLIGEGRSVSDIKVADITAKAGIGKGTAYEYFSTKEELICNAIGYSAHRMMEKTLKILSEKQTVRAQLEQLADWISGNVSVEQLFGIIRYAAGRDSDTASMTRIIRATAVKRDTFMAEVADVILNTAVRENFCSEPEDRNLALFGIKSVLQMMFEVSNSRKNEGLYAGCSREEMIGNCLLTMEKILK